MASVADESIFETLSLNKRSKSNSWRRDLQCDGYDCSIRITVSGQVGSLGLGGYWYTLDKRTAVLCIVGWMSRNSLG